MSLEFSKDDPQKIVHYPKNATRFEFDREVAVIFPNMARRSIPMYEEAHRLHISLVLDKFIDGHEDVQVVDVGASRGAFLKEICNQLQWPIDRRHPRIRMLAIDSSADMLELLQAEMPGVSILHAEAQGLRSLDGSADVISMMYVLQFIQDPADKLAVLQWAYDSLKPGGYLLLGQKDLVSKEYEELFAQEYYRFRYRNGYTHEEIVAKTQALKNSMWPSTPAWLEDMCIQAGFSDYAVTSRWLQFSTSICTKRG